MWFPPSVLLIFWTSFTFALPHPESDDLLNGFDDLFQTDQTGDIKISSVPEGVNHNDPSSNSGLLKTVTNNIPSDDSQISTVVNTLISAKPHPDFAVSKG